MSDYTPDVSAFRGAYGHMYSEWRRDDALAEFDRFIARIKAEAWDEGYARGQTDDEFEATNPYREEGGTVNWDAQSDRAAIRYYSDWCPDGIQEAHRRGARWQREALLSDESVERAAREMCWQANEWEDGQVVWETPEQVAEEIEEWVPLARVALTAAIGGE